MGKKDCNYIILFSQFRVVTLIRKSGNVCGARNDSYPQHMHMISAKATISTTKDIKISESAC